MWTAPPRCDLGANFFNGSFNQQTAHRHRHPRSRNDGGNTFTSARVVNIFLQRPDINLAAAITALQGKRMLEMLAEPNLLAISGQQASFLAGGEFPFPMVQPSAGGGIDQHHVARIRHPAEFPAERHAARHHPAEGRAGSQLARLHQCGDRSGLHDSRPLARAACRPKSNWRAARAS